MRIPPPPPTARWAPTVTFLVHPNLQDPSIAHLVQVHPGPLVILTIATALQPLLLMLPEPMNTLAIRHLGCQQRIGACPVKRGSIQSFASQLSISRGWGGVGVGSNAPFPPTPPPLLSDGAVG